MHHNQMADYQVVKSIQSIINQWTLGLPIALNLSVLLFAKAVLPYVIQVHLGIILFCGVITLCQISPIQQVKHVLKICTAKQVFARLLMLFFAGLFVVLYFVMMTDSLSGGYHCGSYCLNSFLVQLYFCSLCLVVGAYLLFLACFVAPTQVPKV